MLSLLLLCLCLLGFVVESTVLSLPGYLQNGTELFDLSGTNATVVGSNQDPTSNASSVGYTIDQHFKVVIDTYSDLKINGKSTYMSILKAMIQLSYHEGTHTYAGETFSFPNFTNVKIRITRIISSSSTLQYRYAIWGLYRAAEYLVTNNLLTSITMSLFWDGSGVPVLVGSIEILPDPLPDTFGNTKLRHVIGIAQQPERPSNLSDVANLTSIEEKETDLAAKFSVFLEFQGQILSLGEVFTPLFSGVLYISSFRTEQVVHDFQIRDSITQTELAYEHYDASRTSPPFFTYHAAAHALGYIPQYMFAQGRFEAVVFVLEIGNTPVGEGHLRKYSSTLSTASDKVGGN